MKDALQVGGAASVRLNRADQILGGPERIKSKILFRILANWGSKQGCH